MTKGPGKNLALKPFSILCDFIYAETVEIQKCAVRHSLRLRIKYNVILYIRRFYIYVMNIVALHNEIYY